MKKNQNLFKNFVLFLIVFCSFIFPTSKVLAVPPPDNFTLSGGCYWGGAPGSSTLYVDVGIAGSVAPSNVTWYNLDMANINYDVLGVYIYYHKTDSGLGTINYTVAYPYPFVSPPGPINLRFTGEASGPGGNASSPAKYISVANPLTGCSSPSSTNGCTDPAASNYNPSATVNDGSCTYASACNDNSTTVFTTSLPNEVIAGQSYPFVVKATNTGTTWWWHGWAYNMVQTSALNISPGSYGLPNAIYTGWDTGNAYAFNLTAPTTPGQYTLNMSMRHTSWGSAVYSLSSDGTDCAPAPGVDINFGDVASKTFVVLPITISTAASISSTSVKPDDSTTYNITVTGTDTSGAANVSHLYAMVNYQGANAGNYRGFISWYIGDAWPGYQDHIGCSLNGSPAPAGSYAVVQPGYGDSYMHLVSCAITTSGNVKTAVFGVRFKPAFALSGPLTNNDISSYAHDLTNGNLNTGWVNNDLNFSILGPSGTLTGPASCTISGGGSSCSATLNWTLSNPVTTPTTIVGNGTVTVSSSLTASQSGSQAVTVPGGGAQSFSLISNSSTLATASVSSTCASGSTWNGSTCSITPPTMVTLTISAVPTPKGYVSSSIGGISCGTISGTNYSTCSASFAIGSTTSLTATPASSYWQFTGWSTGVAGECPGVGLCTLTITGSKSVQANFVPRPFNYIEF